MSRSVGHTGGRRMLEFLKTLNTDYGNLLMFAVPLATVSYAYHEYRIKRQPVVLPELTYAEPREPAEPRNSEKVRAERALYGFGNSHDSQHWTGTLTKNYP
jgi:hypothetical protein